MDRTGQLGVLVLACLALPFGVGRLAPRASAPARRPSVAASDDALPLPPHVRAIVAGGGPSPDLNQVSLEEDVALAASVLGEQGTVLLFAGGPGTRAVQERDPDPEGDPVVFALGNLFAPRGGRDTHYRATRLDLHGGATLDETFAALELALLDGDAPLFFYFSGHGNGGNTPADSIVHTWGGAAFDARSLAEELEDVGTVRRVRFVVAACYSGGLAELAFRNADAALGATDQDRCGIFSTSWDRESGGCDSDPDRGVHEGFGVYFFSALAGRDREGHDARARIDRDHDGTITLAEALAETRIASRAIDVPVTTSERYLRAVMEPDEDAGEGGIAGERSVAMEEEQAVFDALSGSLGVGSLEAARAALVVLEARREENEDALAEGYAEAEDRSADVAGRVLSRWPVLDDPYHPDYPAMLAESHDELAALFDSEEAYAWADAEDDAAALQVTNDALEVQIVVHLRLVQAAETIALARRLEARGGAEWQAYQRLRACERSAP